MDKQATIRKSKPKTRFMMLPNATAQNLKLSYEALGMLTYIQSLPEDWILHVSTLAREGCGRDKSYRIIAELIEKGYAKRERILNEKKQVTRVEYEVSDFPEFLEANPLPEKPDMDLPDMENQELQRKEVKKESSKEKENTDYAASETKNRVLKEKAPKPYYDAIVTIFNLHGGRNSNMEKMLSGKATDAAHKPYNLDTEVSLVELNLWHDWRLRKYPHISVIQSPEKVQSSIMEYRASQAITPRNASTAPSTTSNAARAMSTFMQKDN